MNKNTIIGFALIAAIMFGFSLYNSKQYEKQMEAQAKSDSLALVEQKAAEAEAMILDSINRANGIVPENANESFVVFRDSSLALANTKVDTTIYTLKNDKLTIEFTPKGAQIHSVDVHGYTAYNSDRLMLIKPGQSAYGVCLKSFKSIKSGADKNIFDTRDYTFDVVEHSDSTITMRLYLTSEGYVQQKYTLSDGSYSLKNSLSFHNLEDFFNKKTRFYDIDWNVTIPRLEKGYKNEKQYSKLNYCFENEDPENLANGNSESKEIDAKIKWFSFQQQFFSAILTSDKQFENADFSTSYYEEDDASGNLMTCSAKVSSEYTYSDEQEDTYEFYFGPNDYKTLKSYDRGYEETIPLGWWIVGWFSRYVIIPCFDFLGGFIDNYGLIILLMTILIKLVISPLTIKSYMSSAKMNVLKPEIDKLNQKYPDQKDAMKKQQAMMELYRKAGVSPMGGCLPMLLQMPILFAMFRFFPACIELRQQGFLWADDLSAYDSILDLPFNIPLYGDHVSLFALLMALSMFLYSKMNSAQMSSDPNMAGMKFMSLYLMPIMMLFICNNLSSALSYYYLLSNIITMIQTWVIKRFIIKPEKILAQIQLSSSKPKPKSKWQMRLEQAQKMQEQMMKEKQQKRK